MVKKLMIGVLSALLVFTPSMTSAHAVVSGEYVIDPLKEAPWAISIWVTENGSEDDGPQFICSGTLYKSQFVLTAAHCFQGIKGTFYIEYGADILGKGKKYPIDAYWVSPRYNRSSIVNDIAVAHILVPITLPKYPKLDTSATTGKSNAKAILYGWGSDQNGEVTGDLRKSTLTFQSTGASAYFGKGFNLNTNISAGKYISKEKIYTAACHGDSGGPLILGSAASPTVAGVVSYGPAESCNLKVPTVFSKVSYYKADIATAENYVMARAKSQSLAPPMNLTAPQISGNLNVGSALSCSTGEWTSNAKSYVITWFVQNGVDDYEELTSAGVTLTLTRELFSHDIWCDVEATTGTKSDFASAKVTLPELAAVATFLTPADGSSVAGTVAVTGRVVPSSDPNFAVTAICLQINGQKPTSGTYGYSNNLVNSDSSGCFGTNDEEPDWSFNVSNWANGDYALTFYAIDGNKKATNKATLMIKVLNTEPVASFISPTDGATVAGAFSIKGKLVPSNRNNNDISKICLKINGKKPTTGSYQNSYPLSSYSDENSCMGYGADTSSTWSFDSTAWANGTYSFTYWGIDASGRQSNTVTMNVIVSNQDPVSAFISPAADSTVAGKFTLKGTSTQSAEGTASIAKVCLKINDKKPTSGSYQNSYPLSSYSDENSCMTYGADTASSWSFDSTAWTNGTYVFTFWTIDSSGRTSKTVTRSLTVANQNPVSAFTSPVAASTVAGKFVLKGTSTPSSEGTASIAKVCLKINGKKPTSGYYQNNYPLNSYSDENSCMTYGADTASSWNFDSTTWANGAYVFTFWAIDSSGRESSTVTRTLTVANQDPVSAFTSPAAASTAEGRFILKGTSTPSSEGTASIAKVCLKINGKKPTSGYYQNNYSLSSYSDENSCMTYGADTASSWYFDTTTWTNGSYIFTFWSIDSSGRESSTVSRTLTVANQDPVSAFTSPSSGSTVSGSFTLRGTATPSVDGTASISKVCLKINSKTPTSGYYQNNYLLSSYSDENSCMSYGADTASAWYFSTSTWTNGSYVFTFWAIDSSGRSSNTVTRTLVVQN